MLAPMMVLLSLKLICIYLPNLLLLSFRVVFAFPIACINKFLQHSTSAQCNVLCMHVHPVKKSNANITLATYSLHNFYVGLVNWTVSWLILTYWLTCCMTCHCYDNHIELTDRQSSLCLVQPDLKPDCSVNLLIWKTSLQRHNFPLTVNKWQ